MTSTTASSKRWTWFSSFLEGRGPTIPAARSLARLCRRGLIDRGIYPLLEKTFPLRVGTLNPKGRISILISYLEPFLRKLQLEKTKRKPLVILINPGKIPNQQLARMYRRVCLLLDDRDPLAKKLGRVLYRFAIVGTRLDANLMAWNSACGPPPDQNGRPSLSFLPQEHQQGQQLLAQMGIPPGAPFVCFGTRESIYYKNLPPDSRGEVAWEDTFHRNSPIESYLPAAQYCALRGIYAVRMGSKVNHPLPTFSSNHVVDYATRFRSDFGDIYLGAHCKFILSGNAGFWWIGAAFNRPVILANVIRIESRPVGTLDLLICKKLWLRQEKRLLTFREMLLPGVRYDSHQNCVQDGIEVIDNTPEELTAVTQEMNDRLDGRWVSTDEDEALQKRFQALYQPHHYSFGFKARIGAEFLRQNKDLL